MGDPCDRAEQAVYLAKKELGVPSFLTEYDEETSEAIEDLAIAICLLSEADFEELVVKHKPN